MMRFVRLLFAVCVWTMTLVLVSAGGALARTEGAQAPGAALGRGDLVSVLVKLDEAPLASFQGGVEGLKATAPGMSGMRKLDVKSAESKAYLSYLNRKLDAFQSRALAAVPQARIIHRYDVVVGGVSVILPAGQVEALSRLPGVQAVYPDRLERPQTNSSPAFVGAKRLWKKAGGRDDAGQGVVVGILDTGVWPEHPSFSDPDPRGNPYPAPPGGPYACQFGNTAWNPADAPFACNNKLIGAYEFLDEYKAMVGLLPGEFDSARDSEGHGTHVAATAAGNSTVAARLLGVPRGRVSGMAPRAHVIMYRVCADSGCYHTDSVAAVQQAVLDGVDVINFSISGGEDPYAHPVELAFLDAYNAGVFVAASAGNAGPGADTVHHRGGWVTTVAASTQRRAFEGTVALRAPDGAELALKGASVTNGLGTPAPVVRASDYGDELCLAPFAPGTFSGEIVVCRRGINARVAKSYNVAQGGAAGMVLYNPTVQDLDTDNHFLPTVHLDDAAGTQLLDFLTAHAGATATLSRGKAVMGRGDTMAAFSSRGGPGQTLGISKPDIAAPGVQILAGHTPLPHDVTGGLPGELYQAIPGTSMASPHVAGAAALLRDLYPDWTPGQIKSALMTTARVGRLLKEDGATSADAFDTGSGRLELRKAGSPGITFEATGAEFLAHQADLWNVNYPSIYHPSMPASLTFQRTARSVLPRGRVFRLEVNSPADLAIAVPYRITVSAGGQTTFDITVDASGVPGGEVRHATLTLKAKGRAAVLPVTVVRAP